MKKEMKWLTVHAAYRTAEMLKAGQITNSEGHFPDLIRVKDRVIVRLRVRE